jgi:hypothetical protein
VACTPRVGAVVVDSNTVATWARLGFGLAMGSWVGGRVGLRGGSLLALWADLWEG